MPAMFGLNGSNTLRGNDESKFREVITALYPKRLSNCETISANLVLFRPVLSIVLMSWSVRTFHYAFLQNKSLIMHKKPNQLAHTACPKWSFFAKNSAFRRVVFDGFLIFVFVFPILILLGRRPAFFDDRQITVIFRTLVNFKQVMSIMPPAIYLLKKKHWEKQRRYYAA